MVKWRKKLDDLSHTPKHISEISAKFAAEIRKVLGAEIDDDIELFDIVEAFEDLAKDAGDDPEDDFNGILRDLYDWADQARVWVG